MHQPAVTERPISEIARAALTEMRAHNVAVTPSNYHVWFEHLTGTNPGLSRAIELVVASGTGFTQQANDDLYERFIGAEHQKLLLKQIQQQTREMLEAALDEIHTASSGAGDYGQKLDTYASNLKNAGALGDIQSIVVKMVEDTHTMAKTSREAHARLEEATERARKLEERLAAAEESASRDNLTGLANRRGGEAALSQAIQEWHATQEPFSLVLADIDHFKKFNDTYGHTIGDAVLRLAACSLRDGIKGQDTAARWGGEEFALILPSTIGPNARHVAESLRRRIAIRKLKVSETETPLPPITMSFGVAQIREDDGLDTLITRADKALYHAKNAGRNRVCSESDLDPEPVVA